jgi:hypothetical protein
MTAGRPDLVGTMNGRRVVNGPRDRGGMMNGLRVVNDPVLLADRIGWSATLVSGSTLRIH